MTHDLLFWIAHFVAVAGWFILVTGVLRRRRSTAAARGAGAMLAAAYLVLFILHSEAAAVLAENYSILGVQRFFADPALALVGWVHYLAFDLWVGAWEVDNATESMPRPVLILVLLLTFAVGPIGLCGFLIARRAWR
jgi:hypothetical protein